MVEFSRRHRRQFFPLRPARPAGRFCERQAEGAAKREAEREERCRAMLAERAAEETLKQPGRTVRITREVCERVSSRRFRRLHESIVCTIERFTAQFLIAADGGRYKLSTITSWEATEGGAA